MREFLRDERGVGTVWAIMWLLLLFGIGGLAVDITSAYRTQTQLQATADAAALAGTISLPVNDTQTNNAAIIEAVNTAYKNLIIQENGTVLRPSEVYIGDWDHTNKTIVPKAGKFPTAVMVTTRRDDLNKNPVPLTFLKILGAFGAKFNRWNVQTQAAAERFIPECLTHSGMVARGVVDYQSNNKFSGDFCIHSEDYVKVSNSNYYGDGVVVSMPRREDIHGPGGTDLATSDLSKNIYPSDGSTLRERVASERLDPRMVDQIDMLMNTFKDPTLDNTQDQRTQIIPWYLRTDPVTGQPMDPVVETVHMKDFNGKKGVLNGWQYSSSSLSAVGQRKIIVVDQCDDASLGNNKITIGDAAASVDTPLILTDLAIITDCAIDFKPYVYMANVVIASGWTNGDLTNDNIKFDGTDILGRPDGCAPGGGMLILSKQTVSSPAQLTMNGVQVVAAGDIQIAAQGMGLNGISFQAGGAISVTSKSSLGAFGCTTSKPPLITSDYYRLVY